jgi:hypothetical protein
LINILILGNSEVLTVIAQTPRKDSKARKHLQGDAQNIWHLKVDDELDQEDLIKLIRFGWAVCGIPPFDDGKEEELLRKCRNEREWAEEMTAWLEKLVSIAEVIAK